MGNKKLMLENNVTITLRLDREMKKINDGTEKKERQ